MNQHLASVRCSLAFHCLTNAASESVLGTEPCLCCCWSSLPRPCDFSGQAVSHVATRDSARWSLASHRTSLDATKPCSRRTSSSQERHLRPRAATEQPNKASSQVDLQGACRCCTCCGQDAGPALCVAVVPVRKDRWRHHELGAERTAACASSIRSRVRSQAGVASVAV